MEHDVLPDLLAKVQAAFERSVAKSEVQREAVAALKGKSATYEDVNRYAVEVGEALAEVLGRLVTAESLPGGKMYYNIAERLLSAVLGRNHELITSYAVAVQTLLNQQARIGLKAQVPDFNRDRVDGLVNRLASEDDFEELSWILQEPIVNFSQSIVDDSIRVNAEFHAGTGLSPKIVRRSAGHCCDWCQAVVGSYTYPDVPKDVYRRHQRCRCTVDYDPKIGKIQNVHSKRWRDGQENAIIKAEESTLQKIQAGAKNYVRDTEKDFLKDKRLIQREAHAYRTYDAIKNSNQDIEKRKIYSNIGQFREMSDFTKKDVDIAFDHVFNDLHDLDFGRGLFPPDVDMADSWSRLISGKGIEEHDLLMLRHERLEHDYMYVTKHLGYDDAHRLTDETYNYGEAVAKYKDRRK